jgi:molybdate transport system substrate-binding protein
MLNIAQIAVIMRRYIFFLLTLFLVAYSVPAAAAESLNVAVATNFMQPFQEIAGVFEKKTNTRINSTYMSSGHFYGQIVQGAPYDLFLSADKERPEKLYKEGLAEKPFIYGSGQVVLWTIQNELCQGRSWQRAVQTPSVKRIAIANVETAPYGTAVMAALKQAGLWLPLEKKFVFAQNIGQAFQYAFTRSVDAGFCALSSALSDQGKRGCYLVVTEAPPIVQSACVLKRSKYIGASRQLAEFLLSPEALAVKRKYGYK